MVVLGGVENGGNVRWSGGVHEGQEVTEKEIQAIDVCKNNREDSAII